jgi:hypothetical protein
VARSSDATLIERPTSSGSSVTSGSTAARPCCPTAPAVVAYVAVQAAVSKERLGHRFWARVFLMCRRECVAGKHGLGVPPRPSCSVKRRWLRRCLSGHRFTADQVSVLRFQSIGGRVRQESTWRPLHNVCAVASDAAPVAAQGSSCGDDVPRRGGEAIFGGVSVGQPQKMQVGSSLISSRSSSAVPGSRSS